MKYQESIIQYNRPSRYFSNKVTVVSFVMAIFVVAIHADNLKYYGLEDKLSSLAFQEVYIISKVLGNIAVPFFFMMSGYWFFRMEIHSSDVWGEVRRKWKKKIKTLVIPYLLWNTFGTVFYMSVTRVPVFANQMNGGEVIPFTLKNLWGGVLLHKYYFTFWYLRDLIIITFILTPLLLIVLRSKLAVGVGLCLLASAATAGLKLDWLETSSVLMFFIGGCMAVYYPRVFEEKQNKRIAFECFLLLMICCVLRYFKIPVISNLLLYISPILMWKACDWVDYHKANWFEHQSFFVYAAHVIPVTIIGHVLKKVSSAELWAAIAYLIAIGLTMAILYIAAQALNKFAPWLYSTICGGR